HDRKIPTALVALTDRLGDFVHIKRTFGNQNHVGSARNSAINGNPAGIATHDFHDHDPVVRFSGGVYAVDGLAHHVDRCVKTECELGTAQVVVDGFGNAYDLDPCFIQLLGD